MSRTTRLLELMLTLQTRPRFRVQDLADEYGVSRRTMLRDLHALSEMGVPLAATPGRHGGYSVIAGRKLLPLSLTADEAIGVLMSYEAFLQYAHSPFAAQSLSAITKLRQAMPAPVIRELDRLRDHVAVLEPARVYEAPLLSELLQVAVDRVHLTIHYDSSSGRTKRTIFPYGLFALRGYWYCACFDYRRQRQVMLRADRILSIAALDLPPLEPMSVRGWLECYRSDAADTAQIRGTITARGMKNIELQDLFGAIDPLPDGTGVIHLDLPESELEYYAGRLLLFGADAHIESPPELVALIREKAKTIAELY